MKPILIDINEMSDSRELYESRPNPWFSILIYTILAIVIVALTWMYFGKIDIVVKSDGIIRPNSQVATVVNTYGGEIESVQIEDGSKVNLGDVLYIINHDDLLLEQEFYGEQLADNEKKIKMFYKYKKSIEDGVNYFENTPEGEEFFVKIESYLSSCNSIEKENNYNTQEYNLNLESVNKQLDKLKKDIKYTEILKSAINSNKNLFSNTGTDQEYYSKYLKYQSDYNILNKRYNSVKQEIEKSTIEEGLINSLLYYNNSLDGLQTLKASVENGKNLFETENSYSLQYKEYVSKIQELDSAYNYAKENYDINKPLEGVAITEQELNQLELVAEEAKNSISNYKTSFINSIVSNITEVKNNIQDITLNKDGTQSKDELLEENEETRLAELENFKLQYVIELDNSIKTLKDNVANLESNKKTLELQGESTVVDADGNNANLLDFQNNELASIINTIETYENKKSELKTNISKINSQIDGAVVKATKSGSINSNIELVEGNYLQAGVEVLSIIPESDSKYKVNIYVNNEDIGKIEVGMNVKLNVYALPNTEYGYLTGVVTSISKDLKVDQNAGSAYYLVESELDGNKLYNSKGQEAELKPGMACQAQMITENKRILVYLLDKLDLWID